MNLLYRLFSSNEVVSIAAENFKIIINEKEMAVQQQQQQNDNNNNIDQDLDEIYSNPSSPACFEGIESIYEEAKWRGVLNISRK
ncbi:MAG: hypothetical protein GY839_07595 [candidate division Zixibacteria bacterium]|nr:hypothetical protein [candidate division Zixibacteria bacterium]